ncbi:hypothetical protein H8B13_18425 [Hymenobacter sp. BT188]|uniref:hypothetical protein n=1 Tax=Hymenobacter sp. BT188 TaxID=2763504 RepID=UPI001651617C|nr:hypothetical protein [Hymenobacter sp. BT188]MBC6608809.1 hypothetical protein [Hymenobacter sp. BT188]
MLYNALYTWAQRLQHQAHTQEPEEQPLVQVYSAYLQRTRESHALPPSLSD